MGSCDVMFFWGLFGGVLGVFEGGEVLTCMLMGVSGMHLVPTVLFARLTVTTFDNRRTDAFFRVRTMLPCDFCWLHVHVALGFCLTTKLCNLLDVRWLGRWNFRRDTLVVAAWIV